MKDRNNLKYKNFKSAVAHTSVDYLLYRTDQRYSLAPESSSFNSRITEYMFKLQSLTPKEIESIFIIIDGLLDNEIKR